MRLVLTLLALLATSSPVLAEPAFFAARDGNADAPVLVVYSSLDEPLARPMIDGFQKANPDVAVRYEEMLTGEVHDRIVSETDAGRKTADFAFSSAMDLQVKLSNDGYAQRSDLPMSDRWPQWANWRNTAYALTFEPAVFVYHKPSFRKEKPPASRAEFLDYLDRHGDEIHGRIATYDIERSGVGFLFMARDQEQFGDIWTLIRAMGAAGVKLYSTSSAILERIADGRFVFGYNILGSYAADWAANHPDVGIVLPKDYTVVMSRIGLVPQAAASPDLGRRYLSFFMSKEGQTIMARELQIAAVSPDVAGDNTASTPVVVDAGLNVADVDNTSLASATVSITGNFRSGEDVLAFTNDGATMGNIAASYNAATGVLTLSSVGSSATLAQWQSALDSVTYTDTAVTPNTATRTVSFTAVDGIGITSNTATRTTTVTGSRSAADAAR